MRKSETQPHAFAVGIELRQRQRANLRLTGKENQINLRLRAQLFPVFCPITANATLRAAATVFTTSNCK